MMKKKNIYILFICLFTSLYCYSQEYQYKVEFISLDTVCTYKNPYIHFVIQIENLGKEPFYLLRYTDCLPEYFFNIFIDTVRAYRSDHILPKRCYPQSKNTKNMYVKLTENAAYIIRDSINMKDVNFYFRLYLPMANNLTFGDYTIQLQLKDNHSKVKKRLKYFETPVIRVRYKEE